MVRRMWNYKQNKNNIGLTRHHRKTVEIMWHMFNRCKEMEQEYIENNRTRHLGQPYLLSNLDKLNILAGVMENKLGLRYTTHPINFIATTKFLMQCVSPLLI